MKTIEELKEKYDQLYRDMADSKDTKKMMLFGSVMNELMEHAIKNDSLFAQKEIDKLESMNWCQYLTKDEAEEILNDIGKPSYKWPYGVWENALNSYGLDIEDKPNYNKFALWVMMNYLYSRHSDTINQKILEANLEEVTIEAMVGIIHGLAVDSLTDKDGLFDVRKFFISK